MMQFGKRALFLFIFALTISGFATIAQARLITVDVQAVGYEQPQDYFVSLLQLALAESRNADEEIQIRFAEQEFSQARWIYQTQHDQGNLVIWTMTNQAREAELLPIRIPLFKGLFGKRVFIIRKEDQPLFDKVKTREDLAELIAGQGMHWPDVNILMANELPVTTAATMPSLFKMLKAKRFDYFPRGVSEAWFELANQQDDSLVVEKNLMLEYPADIYYFVNKNNTELARRIETGLERMITNGSFDAFFHSHQRTRDGLAEVMRAPRLVIRLHNPDLPEIIPSPAEKYWLNLPTRSN